MMKRLLFITDGLHSPTGYGTVVRNVLPKLTDDYEVGIVSLTDYGLPYEFLGVKVFPSFGDDYGRATLIKAIERFNPDFVISLCDSPVHSFYVEPIEIMRERGWKGKWFQYTTIDASQVVKSWKEQVFSKADKVIAMSKFGYETLSEAGVFNLEYIPHGVNLSVFKPIPLTERFKIREALNLKGKFVIGIFGKNQRRKRWATFFAGFKRFIDEYGLTPDKTAVLCHVDLISPEKNEGYFLKVLIDNWGLQEYVYFTHNQETPLWRQDITPTVLNKYYNVCDVVWNQQNEGFGLCVVEAMAAGVPVVMGDYTTAREFSNDGEHSLLVPISDWDFGANGIKFGSCSVEELASAFHKYYSDKGLRRKHGELGLKWVRENYDWSKIIELWKKIFD